jgi:hypothetical protein
MKNTGSEWVLVSDIDCTVNDENHSINVLTYHRYTIVLCRDLHSAGATGNSGNTISWPALLFLGG